MSKDLLTDYVFVLLPLATVAPTMPLHANSLFEVLSKVEGLESLPEGMLWLLVYDLKTLLQ